MELLYATCEMVPFVKVGGLADVAGALTKELARRGHGVHVFLPLYPSVRHYWSALEPAEACRIEVALGAGPVPAKVHRARVPGSGAGLLLLECPRFFDRPSPYVDPRTGCTWPDALLSHTFLCRAILETCRALGWAPDVIHLNDHQTALVAPLLREGCGVDRAVGPTGENPAGTAGVAQVPRASTRQANDVRSGDPLAVTAVILSIHNLGYQGIFPESPTESERVPQLLDAMGCATELFRSGGPLEFFGRLNLMKAGLWYADLITTVSPTYAREIQGEELGFGLQDLLRRRADRIVGILNGIDTEVWDPRTDSVIPYNYGPSDFRGKERNKERLLETLHLKRDLRAPLCGMVSRLVDQKGFDLLAEIAEELLTTVDLRLVILGAGQPAHERRLKELAAQFPERMAMVIGFDEPLAHLIEAGADFFLMPSHYEPCGLNQMYSLRYGTVPIVHATGGLADTVREFDPRTGRGNGFVFTEYRAASLRAAIDRAVAAYGRRRAFKNLVTRIMQIDHSWARAAEAHERVYERAVELRRASAASGQLQGDR